jgi:Protein of unknown function (DUF3592)
MNVLRTLGYVFGAVGALLVAGCLFAVWKVVSFRQHAVRAPGVVVELRVTREYRASTDTMPSRYVTMYAPIVDFETPAGKQRIRGAVRSNVPDYRVGDRVELLYPEGEPARAKIDSFEEQWMLVIVLAPLALGFGGVGAGFGIYFWRRRRLARLLQRVGVRVSASYLGAEVDTGISEGRKHPWRVLCEWRDATTATVYRMRSDPLWQDPRPRITGPTLDVIINPANPRQYRVDVAGLT